MTIRIEGAGENNLQNIDIDIESGLTVVTGVSGSGKTSLVFDTLYHESRRRFLESFTTAASGMRLAPAKVRGITGLGPSVAVGQNLLNRNPGSTLATASGLHPFFRLLYARFGTRHCAQCGAELAVWSADEIVERLLELARESDLALYAPLFHRSRGSHRTLLDLLSAEFGADALHVDGRPWDGAALDPAGAHDLAVRVAVLPEGASAAQPRSAVERSASLGASTLVAQVGEGQELTFSRAPVCPACGEWFAELDPAHFHASCPHCQGSGCPRCFHTGLHPEAASVTWSRMRLPGLLALSVKEARALFQSTSLPSTAARLKAEIERRLEALDTVGLGYVGLDRPSPTLSRGESQRVRLAVTMISRLEDMLHVLDEPTVGQHPADVARLIPSFRRLAGPVVFVEHDRIAASRADHAIDLGPGAGAQGGQVVYTGSPAGLWRAESFTGRYFSLRERVRPSEARRPAPTAFLTLKGCALRTLKDIDVPIPLGRLTLVSGVSGSGKSTLVEEVLAASLEAGKPVGCREVAGPALKLILVDQSPIGINPRSNAATYTGLADIIRDLYAAETGLSSSHFSFNRPEGACPACSGMGAVEVHMRYLPSTWIPCAECQGRRFSDEVLSKKVRFGNRALSIADFFDLRIDEAFDLLFSGDARAPLARQAEAFHILRALRDVGLGYLTLGQPSPTLSGGEAQRVKLTRFLKDAARLRGSRRNGNVRGRPLAGPLSGRLLVLDEPSTGLHPRDVDGLLVVLDRLVEEGATVVVVEHNLDIVRAADWVIDLGPGAGLEGGRLLYAGPPEGLLHTLDSETRRALREEDGLIPSDGAAPEQSQSSAFLSIRSARANNLKDVSVDFPKGALSVVTGVSGSGKSSLVSDVLEAEARRRFLETLSMYERQGVREGPEAPVESVSGLGVSARIGSERSLYDRRSTVGVASELSYHLAVLLAFAGERHCPACARPMRRESVGSGEVWRCDRCGATYPMAEPRHFLPFNYSAACRTCQGVGSVQQPAPHKLIVHPELPLCAGAMYSPGFFPKGYLGKPGNGGYDMVMALARRYAFDPFSTPWNQMTPEAQRAFLFGDPEPMEVRFESKSGRTHSGVHRFPGFYGWVRDWDTGGTYTDAQICPECGGARLKPEYAAVRLGGDPVIRLIQMPLRVLKSLLDGMALPESGRSSELATASLKTARRRLLFLNQVGLGYLNLERASGTLSAGEAQRIRLAGLLGSQLTSLTVLLDEPTRGLHPSEVQALLSALRELAQAGNTVIVVEHEPLFMRAADLLVDMGPGAGRDGGRIVAQGSPAEVMRSGSLTAQWLNGERRAAAFPLERRRPEEGRWLRITGARGNNLRGEEVKIPLGLMVGVCGVSGSGKSTLVIDTLGRALAPRKVTTSVSREPVDPAPYDAIDGAPGRVILVDQARADLSSPAVYLGLVKPLTALYAGSASARALDLDEETLARRCSACGGSGVKRVDMGFLPSVHFACETCQGTGFLPEAFEVALRGLALPHLFDLTLEEVYAFLSGLQAEGEELPAGLLRSLEAAREVGLGYLVLDQPAYSLSGGEAQRLKIASEILSRKGLEDTLYILDEPTVGQHLEDVQRLAGVLRSLSRRGASILLVEHHAHLLAACDWLIELGPGGGPEGGRVVAFGAPEALAQGNTPIAPYLKAALEGKL